MTIQKYYKQETVSNNLENIKLKLSFYKMKLLHYEGRDKAKLLIKTKLKEYKT